MAEVLDKIAKLVEIWIQTLIEQKLLSIKTVSYNQLQKSNWLYFFFRTLNTYKFNTLNPASDNTLITDSLICYPALIALVTSDRKSRLLIKGTSEYFWKKKSRHTVLLNKKLKIDSKLVNKKKKRESLSIFQIKK